MPRAAEAGARHRQDQFVEEEPDEGHVVRDRGLREHVERAVREDALTGTLAQLLLHDPSPSVAALRALKSFAKHEVNTPRATLPPDVALLLYYGAIIAARLRRNERISRLKDDDLRRGLNWAARQLWMKPPVSTQSKEMMNSPPNEATTRVIQGVPILYGSYRIVRREL